jgi:hypothetical protein
MFDLNSDKPKKSFRDIVHECFDETTHPINEAETLHWNQLKRKERIDYLQIVGLPSSFSRDDWNTLDFRAKERLGKMINKTTQGEYALKESIEIFDDVDAKTIALYNKAKAKAIKVAADAKAPAAPAAETQKEECPSGQKMVDGKCKDAPSDETNEEESPVAPDADGATTKVTTYTGKKPKKANKTLILPYNGKDAIEESNNMEEPKRTNVNPFGDQDKLTKDMPDILASIRAVTTNQATPDEFASLAKDVAETHRKSDKNLRTDIMDSLKATKKIYTNAEIHKFQGMVSKELESDS